MTTPGIQRRSQLTQRVPLAYPSSSDIGQREAPLKSAEQLRFRDVGDFRRSTVLDASPENRRRIEAREHQIWIVDGTKLVQASQQLEIMESQSPFQHGQTHTVTKHVGKTLKDNEDRLREEPGIPAAGGWDDLPKGQLALNRTIAAPANQEFIAKFLADEGLEKDVLLRVDLGEPLGTYTTREDFEAGKAKLLPSRTATVVLIKDPSIPEGWRELTSYPEARKPEVQVEGQNLSGTRPSRMLALRQLFGAYLNRDWVAEYGTLGAAIDAYRAETSASRRERAAAELDTLLQSSAQLVEAVDDLGCSYPLEGDERFAADFLKAIRAQIPA